MYWYYNTRRENTSNYVHEGCNKHEEIYFLKDVRLLRRLIWKLLLYVCRYYIYVNIKPLYLIHLRNFYECVGENRIFLNGSDFGTTIPWSTVNTPLMFHRTPVRLWWKYSDSDPVGVEMFEHAFAITAELYLRTCASFILRFQRDSWHSGYTENCILVYIHVFAV